MGTRGSIFWHNNSPLLATSCAAALPEPAWIATLHGIDAFACRVRLPSLSSSKTSKISIWALTSAPADAVVTELATGKYGPDWKKALATVVGGDGITATIKGAPRLFAGAAQRCLLFAVIIAVQLILFDFFRDKLQVAPEDLSLSLDVFADRLSFYTK